MVLKTWKYYQKEQLQVFKLLFHFFCTSIIWVKNVKSLQ